MKKNFLTWLVITAALLTVLNLTYGTYFEGYEAIMNAINGGEFANPVGSSFYVSTWFHMFTFFTWFNDFFHTSDGYGWLNTLYNGIIFSCISASVWFLFQRENLPMRYRLLLFFLFFVLYIENLVYISNHRVSFFSLIGAYLMLYVIQRYKLHKGWYLVVLFLSVLGIFSRLEIAILVSFLLSVFSFLFNRKGLWLTIIVLVISAGLYAFYKVYQYQVYPTYETLLLIEHAFEDNQSIDPEDFKDERKRLIVKAIVWYIRDDEIFTLDEAREICTIPLLDYLRSEKFPEAYSQKFSDLNKEMRTSGWLVLAALVLGGIALIIYFNRNTLTRGNVIKLLIMLMTPALMVIVLNVIVICPFNFVAAVFTCIALWSLVYISLSILPADRSKFYLLGAAILLFVLGVIHFANLHDYEKERNLKASQVRQMMKALKANDKTIVSATGPHYSNYPSRLFSDLYQDKIDHYYADFFYSRFPFFLDFNKKFFGSDYKTVKGKLSRIANHREIVYLSNPSFNAFIADYVQAIHHLQLSFEPVDIGPISEDWQPYYLHLK